MNELNQHEGKGKPTKFQIQIDRVHYTVDHPTLTGSELRQLPTPPIAADRDLFEIVPGHADRKIADGDVVTLHNGQRFFTAPAHINPGSPMRTKEGARAS